MVRKLGGLFFSFLLLALFLPVGARAGARFYFDPNQATVSQGGKLTVTVWVDPGTKAVQTMDVIINYDKTRLTTSQEAIKDEHYFGSAGDSAFNVDDANGRLSLYFFVTQGTASKTGKGKVVTIAFTSKATGQANLNFLCGSDDGSAIRNSDDGNFIDCAANGSGTYTVNGDSAGVTPTVTAAATATPQPTSGAVSGGQQNSVSPTKSATASVSSLPETGLGVVTLGGIVAGLALSLVGVLGLIF